MRKSTFIYVFFALTLAVWGVAQEQPAANEGHGASADHEFAMKAAHVGTAEVELGKLAETKASSDDVKQFARRMVEDHGKAGEELKQVATRKNHTLPDQLDAKHAALRDRLSKLSGAEFDREYMKAMVEGHTAAASMLEKEASNGSDSDLKAWAAKYAPTVRDHLKMARDINSKLGGKQTSSLEEQPAATPQEQPAAPARAQVELIPAPVTPAQPQAEPEKPREPEKPQAETPAPAPAQPESEAARVRESERTRTETTQTPVVPQQAQTEPAPVKTESETPAVAQTEKDQMKMSEGTKQESMPSDLPRTASPLPLVGLLGFSSMGLSLLVRRYRTRK